MKAGDKIFTKLGFLVFYPCAFWSKWRNGDCLKAGYQGLLFRATASNFFVIQDITTTSPIIPV
jgi:hypothetical protein